MSRNDSVEVHVDGPFAGGVVVWQRHRGEFVATVVAKATYALEPELCALLDEPDPLQAADDHWDDDPQRSVRIPSDLALLKSTYDVVVIGHAYAAKAAQSAVARVVVGTVDKCVDARVPSRFTRDGQLDAASPTVRLPLRYEVGAAGPENPVGIDPTVFDEASQRFRLPQLFPPNFIAQPGVMVPFIGVGPIAPSWPMRAGLLRHEDAEWLAAPLERPMPAGFDARYFSVAPPDQRAAEPFHADERLLLECLHPQHPRLVANLAGVRPALYGARGPELAKLVADTLVVDTDRGIVTVSFRAIVPVDLHTRTHLELRVHGSERESHSVRGSHAKDPRGPSGESTVQLDRVVDPRTQDAGALDTTSVELDGSMASVLPFINAAIDRSDGRPRGGASKDAALPFGRHGGDSRVEPAHKGPSPETTAPVPTAKTTPPPPVSVRPGSVAPPPPSSVLRPSAPPPSPPPPAVMPSPPVSVSGLKPPTNIPPPPPSVSSISKLPGSAGMPPPPLSRPSSPPLMPLGVTSQPSAPPALAPLSGLSPAPMPLPPAPVTSSLSSLPLSPAPLSPAPAMITSAIPPGGLTATTGPIGGGSSRGPMAGGPTIGEQRAQTVVPAVVSDALRVSNVPKLDGPAKDPFQAAFAPASKPSAIGSAKAASDAAVDKDVRESAKDRGDLSTKSNVERRCLVDLLSFDEDVPRRLRRSKAFTGLISDFTPPRAFRRLDESDKENDRDERSRLEVLRVLSCGDPVDLGYLGSAIDAAIEDPNDLEIPLFLLSGELRPTFDEIEALRAAVRIAQPLSSTDKRLTAAISVANEVAAATTPPATDTAQALFKQIEGAVSGLNVPNRYLADAVERSLLENRQYKKRVVLGQSRIRCELAVHGGSPWPAYVPESVGPKLPMLTSFTVIALSEVRPREDAFESHGEALFFAALGRVVRKRR